MDVNSVEGKAKGLLDEFKQFISRGSVLDLSVGVIVGGAFKAIADSLTADIIMPFIGIFVDKTSLAALDLNVGGAVITYGNFIQAIINFLIMALVVFLLVKGINSFRRKKEDAPTPPPAPSTEELLLTEIRDLLKEKN